MDKINKYINDWIIFRHNEEKFNEFIKKLDSKTLLDFIIKINKELRFVEDEKDILSEGVIAGELVAATKEVREETLNKFIDYLKQEPDIKEAATLLYYLIINFHMFSDGNGRTARFIYDLLSNNISSSNYMYYFHRENNTHFEGKEDFESERKILDLGYVNWISNSFIKEDIKHYINLYPKLEDKKLECGFGGFYADRQNSVIEFLKTNFNLELTEEEYFKLAQLLTDNGGVKYTPSGVAMLIISSEKGDINSWIETNEKMIENTRKEDSIYPIIASRMNFSFKKNIELLSSWTTSDFKRLIDISNEVKQKQFNHLIEIFRNPEAYTYDEDILLKDYFVDSDCVNKNVKNSL